MKTFKQLILVLTISSFVLACSSDDNGTIVIPDNQPSNNTGNYFPKNTDNYWNYDVEYTDNNDSNNNFTSTDSLFVASETGSMFNLGVNDNDLASGTMNGILVNGVLERTESTLLLDGSIGIPFPGFETSSIDFTDMVLYDLNGANNSQLSSVSGSIDQDIDTGGTLGTVTITISYTISTHQVDNNSSVIVNGVNYSMVSKAISKINMSISIPTPFGNLYIIQNQDVSVATNYFVENIGLVKSETAIEYQANQDVIDIITGSGSEIPFPISGSATNIQTMTNYMVTAEE